MLLLLPLLLISSPAWRGTVWVTNIRCSGEADFEGENNERPGSTGESEGEARRPLRRGGVGWGGVC